jgi:polyisoprenoid-binding protein YceI
MDTAKAPHLRWPARHTSSDGPERWEIDPATSRLGFSLRHLVISEIRGELRQFGGSVFLDRRTPERSKIEVWIDVASIDTGDVARDAHVRSPEFLDVARFPRATFQSTAVESAGEQVNLRGILNLHGTARDVDVRLSLGSTTIDGTGIPRTRYRVQATIDRQSFGLHWNQDLDLGGVVVGDRVEVSGEVELARTADSRD